MTDRPEIQALVGSLRLHYRSFLQFSKEGIFFFFYIDGDQVKKETES